MKNWQKYKVWLSRLGTLFLVLFAIVVFYRYYILEREKQTADVVARIHSTKLTMDDVLGTNLPPAPSNPDATVAGVDANRNGIRDDVELAIFEAYPESAKTRAALLQYALALQMETTQNLVNEGIVIAAVQEESRAYLCVGKIVNKDDMQKYIEKVTGLREFVEKEQLDTDQRVNFRDEFYKNIGSHESLQTTCDIDLNTLSN